MFAAAIAGSFGVLAVFAILRGALPGRPALHAELTRFASTEYSVGEPSTPGRFTELAVRLLTQAKGGNLSAVISNVRVSETTLEEYAEDKLKAALGGAGLVAMLGVFTGFASSPVGMLVCAMAGFAVGFVLPDHELVRKARTRREEFTRALNSFVTLVAVSISGGAGINSALASAASLGDNWIFREITAALHESEVRGTSPWTELERLGRELDVRPLVEVAGALNLAGTDGAKLTESLYARAEAGRSKELTEVRSSAERSSSSLGLPVGCMLVGWALFLGFAALANLIGA